jgi:hypothetical protein
VNYPHLASRMWLAGLAGVAAILLQIAVAAVLMSHGFSPLWLGLLFLAGVPLGLTTARTLPALTFPAMCLIALSVTGPALVVDVPLYGRVVRLAGVDAIPAHAGIAGYDATGWRIETGRSHDERLSAGRGKRPYATRRLAPLVGAGWTSLHPVEAWVAGEIRDSGRVTYAHPQFWQENGGEFIRFTGNKLQGAQFQALRAAEKLGLKTGAEPLIVIRAPSASHAISHQYALLARSAAIPAAVWLAFVLLAGLIIDRRR